MSWDELTALCAAFGLMGVFFLFCTSAVIERSLNTSIGKLKKEFAEEFARKDMMDQRFREIEGHFDYLRDQVEPIMKDCPLIHAQQRTPGKITPGGERRAAGA